MKKVKIFVIENEFNVVELLREELKPLKCEVLPSIFDSNVDLLYDPKNQRDMEEVYKDPNMLDLFSKVLDEIKDIDLFIIDVSIRTPSEDNEGINILNYLGTIKKSYNNGESKFIILSQHDKFDSRFSDIHQDVEYSFILKDITSSYMTRIYDYVNDQYNLDSQGQKNTKLKKRLNRIEIFIEDVIYKYGAKMLDGLISLAFAILMFGAISFAAWGITNDFLSYANQPKDKINNDRTFILNQKNVQTGVNEEVNVTVDTFLTKNLTPILVIQSKDNGNKNISADKTSILEVVERIFIYLLPLFILLGFYNYYASTTAVRLRGGGKKRDIDHNGSVRGINTSKIILLSALLSFTLINAIEQVFILRITDIYILLSYGIFIVILMAFILIINSQENVKNGE